MPLPKPGAPWPAHNAHTEKLAEWSAWYSGDPSQLSTFYGPRTGAVSRPAQYAGGVVGRLARWWWGQPTPVGEQRAKLHVPLAADICGTSADLLFSESVRLSSDNPGIQKALETLQDGGLDTKLHEAAEVQAALGGVYLRTVWDESVSPMPWTEVAHPDGAVPEWRHGRLNAVTLWNELPNGSTGTEVYRLFERHESGGIMYALYKGTATNVGKLVPVQSHPDAAYLADLVTDQQAFYDGNTIIQPTLIDRLTAAYVPNMLPNRLDRRSPQGRSDLQGVEPFLDALDEAYSGWWRDIRLAKSRIHVPASMVDSAGPGQPGYVELDREVYVPVEGVLARGDVGLSQSIYAHQFEIRVQEHKDTCEAWTKTIVEAAGYSTQSLSSDTGGAVTATEVRAHQSRSFMTRGKKVRYWTAALQDHLRAQLEIATQHLGAGIPDGDLSVEFPDGVQESPMSMGQTLQTLRNAEAASTRTRVQMLHPDWDDQAVDDEVALIHSETGVGEPLPIPDDTGL
ncbi:phage portal protein [Nocardioides sp. R1-1]|uniref:phage portal protein n=1 Tax=Nocardioides sp. R1-1 TaxID=3383502 RepID=UPI0038D0303A